MVGATKKWQRASTVTWHLDNSEPLVGGSTGAFARTCVIVSEAFNSLEQLPSLDEVSMDFTPRTGINKLSDYDRSTPLKLRDVKKNYTSPEPKQWEETCEHIFDEAKPPASPQQAAQDPVADKERQKENLRSPTIVKNDSMRSPATGPDAGPAAAAEEEKKGRGTSISSWGNLSSLDENPNFQFPTIQSVKETEQPKQLWRPQQQAPAAAEGPGHTREAARSYSKKFMAEQAALQKQITGPDVETKAEFQASLKHQLKTELATPDITLSDSTPSNSGSDSESDKKTRARPGARIKTAKPAVDSAHAAKPEPEPSAAPSAASSAATPSAAPSQPHSPASSFQEEAVDVSSDPEVRLATPVPAAGARPDLRPITPGTLSPNPLSPQNSFLRLAESIPPLPPSTATRASTPYTPADTRASTPYTPGGTPAGTPGGTPAGTPGGTPPTKQVKYQGEARVEGKYIPGWKRTRAQKEEISLTFVQEGADASAAPAPGSAAPPPAPGAMSATATSGPDPSKAWAQAQITNKPVKLHEKRGSMFNPASRTASLYAAAQARSNSFTRPAPGDTAAAPALALPAAASTAAAAPDTATAAAATGGLLPPASKPPPPAGKTRRRTRRNSILPPSSAPRGEESAADAKGPVAPPKPKMSTDNWKKDAPKPGQPGFQRRRRAALSGGSMDPGTQAHPALRGRKEERLSSTKSNRNSMSVGKTRDAAGGGKGPAHMEALQEEDSDEEESEESDIGTDVEYSGSEDGEEGEGEDSVPPLEGSQSAPVLPSVDGPAGAGAKQYLSGKKPAISFSTVARLASQRIQFNWPGTKSNLTEVIVGDDGKTKARPSRRRMAKFNAATSASMARTSPQQQKKEWVLWNRFQNLPTGLEGLVKAWVMDPGHDSGLPDLQERAAKRAAERLPKSPIAVKALAMNPAGSTVIGADMASAVSKVKMMRAEDELKTVASCPPDKHKMGSFKSAITDVRVHRPYFIAPIMDHERFSKSKHKVERKPWDINTSIFARRRLESDAKGYVDTKATYSRRLEVDWKRATTKSRFREHVAKSDNDGFARVDQELEEVRQAFDRNYDILCRAYAYFCCLGNEIGESAYSMKLNQWSMFLEEAQIPDEKSKFCQMKHLDILFKVVNFESGEDPWLDAANDDHALMRWEFIEIITRCAIAKYGRGVVTTDVSDAVEMLIEENILRWLPAEAVEDNNDFRKHRLYCEEVASVFEKYQKTLRAIFTLYKAQSPKLLSMEQWFKFCEQAGLITSITGVSNRQCKQCFVWSQMEVTDELKSRPRTISLYFVDFLEAIGRMAEAMSPPTLEEIKVFFESGQCGTDSKVAFDKRQPTYDYYCKVPEGWHNEHRRLSRFAEYKGARRPLWEKLEQVLEIVFTSLMVKWGMKTLSEMERQFLSLATMEGGGATQGF